MPERNPSPSRKLTKLPPSLTRQTTLTGGDFRASKSQVKTPTNALKDMDFHMGGSEEASGWEIPDEVSWLERRRMGDSPESAKGKMRESDRVSKKAEVGAEKGKGNGWGWGRPKTPQQTVLFDADEELKALEKKRRGKK